MNLSKRFFVGLVLLALLVPAVLAAAPEREVVAVEYLQTSVEFEALTAAPGETVQREVRVPVRFHYADGTSEVGYEPATFTLTNETAVSSSTVVTIVTCFGTLNQDNRHYTARVSWEFNGSWASVYFIVPWVFNVVSDSPPYGEGSHPWSSYLGAPAHAFSRAMFIAGLPDDSDKMHQISWTLPHDSPNCTAQGYIVDI